jgi:hypothetical protein
MTRIPRGATTLNLSLFALLLRGQVQAQSGISRAPNRTPRNGGGPKQKKAIKGPTTPSKVPRTYETR